VFFPYLWAMEFILAYIEIISVAVISLLGGSSYFLFKRKTQTTPKLKEASETVSETELSTLPQQPLAKKQAVKPKTLESALAKSRETIFGRLESFFAKAEIEDWEEMEEVLYTSDLGPKTVQDLLDYLQEDLPAEIKKDPQAVKEHLKIKLKGYLDAATTAETSLLKGLDDDQKGQPLVWMIVGVNGSGKTTTLGKLASLLSQQNKKVMVAAGDTFRAAADKQLQVWATRAGVEVFSPENVNDPSAVAYQALEKAKAEGFDHLLVDTAGRLHTQKNLMEELKKMKRVLQKLSPGAPHETIIILDANNGQNALQQAKEFHQALDLSGVIFTKMDGSAKAGVAFGISNELSLPIKRIGIGESLEDLRQFKSKDFVDSIFV